MLPYPAFIKSIFINEKNKNKKKCDNLNLFLHGEIKCNELNKPGSAVVFPSFINHKVDKLLVGRRHTLAIWMYGPRFK